MITILQPPACRRLIPLVAVKARMGITTTDQDADLTKAIEDVSQAIRNEVGQPEIGRALYRRTFAGHDRPYRMMPDRPIESLVSVSYQGTPVSGVVLSDREVGKLYLEDGWIWTAQVLGVEGTPQPGTERLDYSADYWAGYLMPEQVTSWTAGATVAARAWIRPSPGLTSLLFQVTAAGVLGLVEPAWPTDPAATTPVTDGTAVLTPFPAFELPEAFQRAAWEELRARMALDAADPTIQSETFGQISTTYRTRLESPDGSGSMLSLQSEDARRIVFPLKRSIL